MPYISQGDRLPNSPCQALKVWPSMETEARPLRLTTPGELNYAMTMLAIEYAKRWGISYTTFNEVMGVFASAQAEFYRRVVVPYENIKREENGDVYDCIVDLLMPIERSQPPTQEVDHDEPD